MGGSAHLLKVLHRDNIRLSIPAPSIWLPTPCMPSLCLSRRLPILEHRSCHACLELPELLGQAGLLPSNLPQLFVLHNQVSIQAADLLRQCPAEETRQVCSDSHVSIQHAELLGLHPAPYQPAFSCRCPANRGCINATRHRGCLQARLLHLIIAAAALEAVISSAVAQATLSTAQACLIRL